MIDTNKWLDLFPHFGAINHEKLSIRLHYDNGTYLAEIDFGIMNYRKERNADGRCEVRDKMDWKSNDKCVYRNVNNHDFYAIRIEKVFLSLKKMCEVLDILEG